MLVPFVSTLHVTETVSDEESLLRACRAGNVDAVLFEASGTPWPLDDVVRGVRGLLEAPVLVGTLPQGQRRHHPVDGVLFVSRASSIRSIASALRGNPMASAPGPRIGNELADRAPDSLTGREFQILALIAGGLTTSQIAIRLGIAAKTVENRRQTLFTKLGVQNQSHAVAVAMRTGLLGGGSGPRLDP